MSLAVLLVSIGWLLVVLGVGMVSIPFAIIMAGAGVAVLGLLAIDVDRKVRP
jgi:UDP-N-acetyl-D-mannosaminuronate dehydrogenase